MSVRFEWLQDEIVKHNIIIHIAQLSAYVWLGNLFHLFHVHNLAPRHILSRSIDTCPIQVTRQCIGRNPLNNYTSRVRNLDRSRSMIYKYQRCTNEIQTHNLKTIKHMKHMMKYMRHSDDETWASNSYIHVHVSLLTIIIIISVNINYCEYKLFINKARL